MLGGNGIIYDNYVIKALADIEAIYTYEGTYDINALVAGRELTGIAAFKAAASKWNNLSYPSIFKFIPVLLS